MHTNLGFIICYDINNVNIEVMSIQKLINIDRRKLVMYNVVHIMSKLVCVCAFHAIVLKRKENTDILIKQINHKQPIFL